MNTTKTRKLIDLPDLYFSADKSTPNVECVAWFGEPDPKTATGTYWSRRRFQCEDARWCVTVIAPTLMYGEQDGTNDEIRAALHKHAVANGVKV